MADFTIVPLPIKSGTGLGFWQDLKELLLAANETLLANTRGADSSSDSSSGADVAYDPDATTVTELFTGIDAVIASFQDL